MPRIELTPAAEQALRGLERHRQEVVSRRIDVLAASGLPPALRRDGAPDGGEEEAGDPIVPVRAGDDLLFCLERPRRNAILVVALRPAGEGPSGSAARGWMRRMLAPFLAPWSAAPRRRLRASTGLSQLLADLVMDARFALRSFRRSPGFALVTVLVLALGLGANTAIFGVFHRVFLAALPFPDGDRMVRIQEYRLSPSGQMLTVNNAARSFHGILERNRVFGRVVAQDAESGTLTDGEEPDRASVVDVSEGWLETLGIGPARGRGFTDGEEARGREAGVVLMAHGLWERRYGGDPSMVGGTIQMDGRPVSVVGIMPPRFHYPYSADLWRPAVLDPSNGTEHSWNVVGRLREGVTLEEARRDLARIAGELQAEFPDTNEGIGLTAVPARDNFIEDQEGIVVALLGAVAFLLLLACLNVATLLTARFLVRGNEMGIRAALGAGRGRQLRQLVTETVVLFLLGGALGYGLAFLAAEPLAGLVPSVLRGQLDLAGVTPGWTLAGFTLALSLVTGVAFGGVAALRGAGPAPARKLAEGGRGGAGGGRGRLRLLDGLVMAEVAVALVLMTGAGLMLDRLRTLQAADPGFEARDLATLRIDLAGTGYREPAARTGLVRALESRLEALPGVAAAGITTVNPNCCGDWGARVVLEGMEAEREDASIVIHHRLVSPGLHRAMGIRLVRGRLLRESDDATAPPVVLVDERMADHFWPDQDPIGKRIKRAPVDSDFPWRTVVGVVERVDDHGDYTETWYVPYAQDPLGRSSDLLHLMVRTRGSGDLARVREAVHRVDPTLALYDVRFMGDLREENLSSDRLGTVIVGAFGLLGLTLAAFGLYGLMSYLVGRRAREMAVRRALGADGRAVVRLVLEDSVKLLAGGLVAGGMGAWALGRLLGAVVGGIEAPGAWLLFPAAAVLLVAGVAATLVPAWRAARVDPQSVLRG